jgi:hypothetical protein
VARSPILPLAAAVTAVALGAWPATAAPLSPGKRDTANVVAFPLLAVKVPNSVGLGYHVSHSSHDSHVSGGGYHSSHSSHDSHSSSVPAPVASGGLAPAAPGSGQPAPASSQNLGSPAGVSSGSPPAAAPSQSGLGGSPLVSGSGSPAANGGGGGCAFVVIVPFSAAARGIKRLATWRRSR